MKEVDIYLFIAPALQCYDYMAVLSFMVCHWNPPPHTHFFLNQAERIQKQNNQLIRKEINCLLALVSGYL